MPQGELPADYLEQVRATLATAHLPEQRARARLDGRLLAAKGHGEPITLLPGLTDAECTQLDRANGLRFPPDLRSFLQAMLPVRGQQFPNWREDAEGELARGTDEVRHGLRFDVEFNNQWPPSWGERPTDLTAALARVDAVLAQAPRLLRVVGHRFLPALPCTSGNPVFSIVQMDIIPYGADLADYFHREFGVPRPDWAADTPRSIPFWTDLITWGSTPL
jgi:hypothetical protein